MVVESFIGDWLDSNWYHYRVLQGFVVAGV